MLPNLPSSPLDAPYRDALIKVRDSDPNWTDYTVQVQGEFAGGNVDHLQVVARTDGYERSTRGLAGKGYEVSFTGPGG